MKMTTLFCLLVIISFTSTSARALLEKRIALQLVANRSGEFSVVAPLSIPPPVNALAVAATPVNAAPATQPAQVASSPSSQHHRSLKCVKWRKTLQCTPSGARDPMNDKDCLTLIAAEESGFCECEGYVHTAAVPCGHPPVNCTKECGTLQINHRETFSAGVSNSDDDNENAQGGADPDRTIEAIKAGKDPYAQALKYGQRAMQNVNDAVTQSNTLLGSARQMIAKMTNLKPWADITQMGKDAEAAGKKTQELAKIARPFIYTQVDLSP